jgi:hypothetical protein
MTTASHQRERRYSRSGENPAAHHGFGASSGPGGGAAEALRAWSSIRCASRCNSAAAARRASDPFRRTSGTTSSLIYFTAFFKSVSRCVAASLSCCSQGRFGSPVAIRTPLHYQLDDAKNPRVNVHHRRFHARSHVVTDQTLPYKITSKSR